MQLVIFKPSRIYSVYGNMHWSVFCHAMCWTESTLTSQSWAKWAQWEQVSGRGPYWEEADEERGGDGEDSGTSTTGLLPMLAAMRLWSMSGWLSSPVFILRGEWGCFKWGFGGLEGGDISSFRWSDEIGLCRVACTKSTMTPTLLTGTQTKIETAIAVTSLHS